MSTPTASTADRLSYVHGDQQWVIAPVVESANVHVGDLIYYRDRYAWPAHRLQTSQGPYKLQSEFARYFLGVAMQASQVGVASTIKVATSGVFRYPCPETIYSLGDLVGSWLDDDYMRLYDQKVVQVFDPNEAIGRVQTADEFDTKLLYFAIQSTIMSGGVMI